MQIQTTPSRPHHDTPSRASGPTRGFWLLSWLTARGEGIVAGSGLSLALLLLLVVGAGAAWTTWVHRGSELRAQRDLISSTARTLGASAGPMLAANDVAGLRAVLTEAAARTRAQSIDLTLSNGDVVVSSRPGVAPVDVTLPERWDASRSSGVGVEEVQEGEDVWVVRVPVRVDARGDAVVEARARTVYSPWSNTSMYYGTGAIGVLALLGWLGVYHRQRTRLRALGAIQETLRHAHQFAEGELPTAGLRLGDDLGEEAMAWNRLLEERDRLRRREKLERAGEKLLQAGQAQGTTGDHAAAFDAVWMGLIVLDESARVRCANGAAAVLLRRPRNDLAGQPASEVLPSGAVLEQVEQACAGRQRQRTSLELRLDGAGVGGPEAGEPSILRFTLRPLRREDSCAVLLAIEDVTQLRIAEESRNAFVGQATHELRTPLTTMRLYIEQLVDEGERDPLVKARCLNVLASETRRLERIVGDMLSVAEMDAGTFSLRVDDVDLPPLFEELRQDYEAQARDKELTLSFDLPPKWPRLRADRDKFSMALHNLLGNAIKYTPVNGSVGVRVLETESGTLVVEVSDTGIGIAPDEQALVFEKFYRSKDRRVASITGTGIGLALAREVVRLHGGDVTLRSQLDQGSTFVITIPLEPAASGGVGERRAAA